MSDKIKPHHVERKAILYVRQSSAYQVQNNLESQKLQYAMRDRLCNLGWHDIEVVDEDLGPIRIRRGDQGGLRTHGCRSVPGPCGCGSGQRGLALCPQQSGVAEAGRSLSCGGHATDRSGDGVHTAAKQRSPAARVERQLKRV